MGAKVRRPMFRTEDGLPSFNPARPGEQSILRRLLHSSRFVTVEVLRLWARAKKTAHNSTISKAFKQSVAVQAFLKTPPIQLRLLNLNQRKQLMLLKAMGMVWPRDGAFKRKQVYILFPSDSKNLTRSKQKHPFGVLADNSETHVFVFEDDLEGANHPIDEILKIQITRLTKIKFLLHIIHRNEDVQFISGYGPRRPLIAVPSVVCCWHLPLGPGSSEEGHYRCLHIFWPLASRNALKYDIPPCVTWRGWCSCLTAIDSIFQNAIRKCVPVGMAEVPGNAHPASGSVTRHTFRPSGPTQGRQSFTRTYTCRYGGEFLSVVYPGLQLRGGNELITDLAPGWDLREFFKSISSNSNIISVYDVQVRTDSRLDGGIPLEGSSPNSNSIHMKKKVFKKIFSKRHKLLNPIDVIFESDIYAPDNPDIHPPE